MKYIINRNFGGFCISHNAEVDASIDPWWEDEDAIRTNEILIKLIEEGKSDYVSGRGAKLMVVEIPDEATDWELVEYDGVEHIIAVIDERLVHIYEDGVTKKYEK